MRFNEVEENDRLEWLIRKDGCMHCSEPGCLKACPAPGAIIQYANGIVDFQSDKCIGCGYCIAGCPFNIPRMNPEDNRVYKCTLCVDACPCHAISGKEWQPGIARSEMFSPELCSQHMKRAYQHIGRGAVCGICMRVCPQYKKQRAGDFPLLR